MDVEEPAALFVLPRLTFETESSGVISSSPSKIGLPARVGLPTEASRHARRRGRRLHAQTSSAATAAGEVHPTASRHCAFAPSC
eukprot:scaffold16694_cov125-Isochrysis_galbana.AAC.1